MFKNKKCGRSIIKAIVGCAGLAKSQDPFSISSCFWEITDTGATCWKEVQENRNKKVIVNRDKVFMQPYKYNYRKEYVRPIRSFRYSKEEETELKEIISQLNRDRTIKKEHKPSIKSGVLLVTCSNCGHEQQVNLVGSLGSQKFICKECNCESGLI